MASVFDQAINAPFPWQRRAWTARTVGLTTLATAVPVFAPLANEGDDDASRLPGLTEYAKDQEAALRVA